MIRRVKLPNPPVQCAAPQPAAVLRKGVRRAVLQQWCGDGSSCSSELRSREQSSGGFATATAGRAAISHAVVRVDRAVMPAAFPCFGCLPLYPGSTRCRQCFFDPHSLSKNSHKRKQNPQATTTTTADCIALRRTFQGSAVYFTVTCVSVT